MDGSIIDDNGNQKPKPMALRDIPRLVEASKMLSEPYEIKKGQIRLLEVILGERSIDDL